MEVRTMHASSDGRLTTAARNPSDVAAGEWLWVDVIASEGDLDELVALTTGLALDPVAVLDAVADSDAPKVDDFGHHLLAILYGLRDDRVETYEVDCFLTDRHLVTVHAGRSPALDALWDRMSDHPELGQGGVDELLARVADTLMRRLLAVVDAFDTAADSLLEAALAAETTVLEEVTAARSDLADVRRVVVPQREALDVLRILPSPLISEAGRRRFSDAFDVASRAVGGLDTARANIAGILDAYRGAEARKATDVTMVLTIYAAIMLPLALVAGFFGMNVAYLPGADSRLAWLAIALGMLAVAALSLGVFVAVGWIRRPSGRRAGATLGRGLIETARAPVHIASAMYEISTMPLRSAGRRSRQPDND